MMMMTLTIVQRSQLKDKTMKGNSHYLHWTSNNEAFSLRGDKLLKFILEESEEAIYYSNIAAATSDIFHEEENVLILRHISQSKESE
jgi:hypothetical protein